MLKGFFQTLFRKRPPLIQEERKEAPVEPQRPQESAREFSDKTSREYTVLGLQRTTEVLEEYHFWRRDDRRENTTLLNVEEESGEQEKRTFPGAIPEPYFPQLLRQRVKWSTDERALRDPSVGFMDGCEWRCTQNHTLEILTGELAGQQFEGRRYWLDDAPSVVKNQSTSATT